MKTSFLFIFTPHVDRLAYEQTNIVPDLFPCPCCLDSNCTTGLFVTNLPPGDSSKCHAAVYDTIGSSSLAFVRGVAAPACNTRFRQSTEIYYLRGVETPHFYMHLDGA
jgi:hypothetical protein